MKDGKYFIESDAENASELGDIIRAVASELEIINCGGQSEILSQLYVHFEIDDAFLQSGVFGESIVDQDLRGHAKNFLHKAEVRTIYDLVKIKLDDLRKYRGFGPTVKMYISDFLKFKGLHFEMTDEDIRMYYNNSLSRK